MTTQQHLQLEDAEKRLSMFRKHLDLLVRCSGESKNVDAEEILSAVSELQSLVEWAAQQPELGAESAVLLVKLQELHQIRENLEKTPKEVGEHLDGELKNNQVDIVPDKSENYSNNLECISDIITADLCDNNGDNVLEEDSINLSGDKESLCDFSASTEDPNLANAESPDSIELTSVDIIPSDDKVEETMISPENDYPRPVNDPRGDLNNEENQQDLGDRESSVEQNKEIPLSVPEIAGLKSPNLFRSEVVIIETDEDNNVTECLNDSRNSNDPLDVCMYAIRNLYESLKVKENELLKLSAMQNDQKHIEALQAVIIDFHKDITNLNSQLDATKKENVVLKEQVLELEEAENDARLEAQKLEQKLVFLQEKDSHSQAELSQLKQALKKNTELLADKEASEKELRSQLKYMETLVQKYEDQIKVMEAKEIANFQKLLESKLENSKEDSVNQSKTVSCDKGTQTYPISQTKINSNGEVQNDSDNGEKHSSISETAQVPDKTKTTHNSKESETVASSIASTSNAETSQPKEDPSLVSIECISQKDLLTRLHKLIDEDVSLQQQIHYVDQINLALWKKLQNLDNHIGECKRQNINETDPVISEPVVKKSSSASLETEQSDQSGVNPNRNIPEDISNCLKNEQYIQERLTKLEEINVSFEKELKTRENICKEKEKKHGEWNETEKQIMDDLKRLSDEKDYLADQINNLKTEKQAIEKRVLQYEEELNILKQNNQMEISKIKTEQESVTDPLITKVNQLLTKEKEILKMITILKAEKTKNQDKRELERLKCSYIELQLELSHFRDEIQRIEEQYKILLEENANKHLLEETQRMSEIERLCNENTKCEKLISTLESKQQDIINTMEKREKYLQHARENFEKNLEETEEVHRSVETELKTQLDQIEEGTVIATTALMEERKRVEKELQENIDDLRSKEEIYKARISELEQDVIHLHKELHKMAEDSEPKEGPIQPEANSGEENKMNVKSHEKSHEKTVIDNQNVPTEIFIQTPDPKRTSISPQENIVEEPEHAIKDKMDRISRQETKNQEEYTEENVDELRAQVRELQSHLEKISVEASDMPPVQPVKPIQPVKRSLGSQKLEDLDYAEVDDCLDTWRKSEQNTSSKDISSNVIGGYGNKNYSGSVEKTPHKRVSSQEPVEENDYDEVLPRPTNFHVVQQVGSDTLLVGWNYVNPSILDGFEVYLGNQVHERIYIPDRTKALISGLNLRKPIHLSIYALSRYGQMSEPAVLDISLPQDINSNYFEDDDDEYRDFEDPLKRKQRPYSMEW